MLVAFLIVITVIFDQITKNLAVQYVYGNGNIPFLPHVLSFEYLENKGAAWGILSEHRWVFMSISVLAILFIIGFFVYCHIKKEKLHVLLTLSLAFVCGGGIGNMIDRIALGYVIDFLKFDFIDFPVFNVADSFICIGAALAAVYLVVDLIFEIKTKLKKDRGND